MRRSYFNMIEVTLALLVISIGVVSIFGLIPMGYKAHRDAIYHNHSADAAEEVLNRLSYALQDDWSTTLAYIPAAPPDISSIDETSTWNQIDGYLYYTTSGSERIYRFFNNVTLPSGRNVTDFDGIIRVWKTPTTGFEYDVSTSAFTPGTDATFEKRVMLNLEVCWPTTSTYDVRRRAFYSMEVMRGQE